ncbi:MAG: PorT family protein [Prevotellaceae bacterium]|nr:PorT family protein [Prevotellaceae bacterium]
MKKLLIIAALVGLGITAQAKMLAFGVKGGINMPSIEFETKLTTLAKPELGFHAGFFGQLNIPIIGLGIQPELLYLNQPVVYISDLDAESGWKNATKRISYLEVPLNITWGIDLKVVRPFIAVTPYLRYAFNDVKTYADEAVAKALETNEAPNMEELNHFDYGIGVGAGIDLFSKLQLMGRYSWGLSNLVKDGDYKVRSFTVSLGYIF